MANRIPKRPDITPEMVVSRYRGGRTIPSIATELACSTRTVLERLRKAHEPTAIQGGTKVYPVLDRHEQKARKKARIERWRKEHPERVRVAARAGYQLRKALKEGRLIRPDICENCGIPAPEPPQAAHENYYFPLLVRWLCRPCHMIWDHDTPKSTRFERRELT